MLFSPPPPSSTAIVVALLCSSVMVQLLLSDTAANHQQYYPGWGVAALSMIPQPPPPPKSLSLLSVSSSRRQMVVTTTWNTLGLLFSVPGWTHAAAAAATNEVAATAATPYQAGPRGVRYRILQPGTGNSKPERGQQMELSYTLWLEGFPGEEDNNKKAKQIDSSKKPLLGDQPLKIRAGVNQVIKGWDLIVLDMTEGERRQVIIPPELGYGTDKAVGPIPKNSTLYFDMTVTKLTTPMTPLTPEALTWLDDHPL